MERFSIRRTGREMTLAAFALSLLAGGCGSGGNEAVPLWQEPVIPATASAGTGGGNPPPTQQQQQQQSSLLTRVPLAGKLSSGDLSFSEIGRAWNGILNDRGDVAYTIWDSSGSRVYVWRGGQTVAISGPIVGEYMVSAINEAGQVAGFVNNWQARVFKVWLWTEGALEYPVNHDYMGWRIDLNNRGHIVSTDNGAVLYRNGQVERIGDALFGYSYGKYINDRDQVVIMAIGGGPRGYGYVLWDSGQIAALPMQEVSDINNEGVVLGSNLLWRSDNDTTALPPLPGFTGAYAHALNDAGQAVGTSHNAGESGYRPTDGRATLWQPDGTPLDLNTRVPAGENVTLTIGVAVNDRGQVLAVGRRDGESEDSLYLLRLE